MAAEANELDVLGAADLTALHEVSAGVAHLVERGALPRARSYAAVTCASAEQLYVVARAHGLLEDEVGQFVRQDAALRPVAKTLMPIAEVLRAIVSSNERYRSALFVPAPNLSAFAVAGVELPIVYGSGLLRRTPEPIAIVPWQAEPTASAVLQVIASRPGNAAVLLANRGVIAYSDEPFSKLAKFVVSLEESAQLTLNAALLGGARALPSDAFEQMQQGIAGE
jgi:hypothetical protein